MKLRIIVLQGWCVHQPCTTREGHDWCTGCLLEHESCSFTRCTLSTPFYYPPPCLQQGPLQPAVMVQPTGCASVKLAPSVRTCLWHRHHAPATVLQPSEVYTLVLPPPCLSPQSSCLNSSLAIANEADLFGTNLRTETTFDGPRIG